MAVGRSVASFLEGAIAGQTLRQNYVDMKRRRDAEDLEVQWAKEDRAIAAEDRDYQRRRQEENDAWAREQRGVTREEQARLKQLRQEQETVFADALAEAEKAAAGEDGTPAATIAVEPAEDAPTEKKKRKTPPAPGRNVGRSVAKPPSAAPATPPQSAPVVPQVPQPDLPPAVVPPGGAMAAAPITAALTAPAADQAPAAPVAPPRAPSRPVQGPPEADPMAAAIRVSDGRTMPPTPSRAAPAPVQPPAMPGAMPVQGPEEADPMRAAIRVSAPADAPARNLSRVPDTIGAIPTEAPAAPMAPAAPGRSIAIPGAAAAAPAAAPSPMASPGGDASPAAPAPLTAPSAPVRAPVPSAAPAGQPVVTPSMEIAAETDGMGQRVDGFLKAYREKAVPKIMRFYLGRGDLEQAQVWEKWAKDGATQEGMAAWARGVHAAADGDEAGFVNSMIEAYNADGYFDDGYQAVRSKSGLVKNDQGDVVGAKVTLRNQQTGQEFVKSFDDIDDVYQFGVRFLSPEAVFEYGQQQLAAAAAANEATQKQATELDTYAAKKVIDQQFAAPDADGQRKRLEGTIKMMAETDFTFAQLPVEQQIARAMEMIRAQDAAVNGLGALPSQPPVYRGG